MECAALLRSFGIKSTVVDFHRPTGDDSRHPQLFEWVSHSHFSFLLFGVL